MLAVSDLRIILKLLQASCLAPYTIGRDGHTSKRSLILIFYNLSFAGFVMYNVIYAENDTRNDVDYENKSFLIGIAFDTVDVLENIHPCFISLRSLIFTKAGIDIWFKINRINQKFKHINVEFDHGKLRKYTCAKVACFLVLALLFLAMDIILCGALGIFYTTNYWVLCAIPLIQNSIMAAAFGGLVLILYQRFWAINELIIRAIQSDKEAWGDVSWQQFNYENLSGNLLYKYYLNQSINLKKSQVRAKAKTVEKKPPFFAMLKNHECFGGNFYSERNLVKLIRYLKILHFDLFEVTKDVNSIFGWNLLFVFTTAFFGVTINMYFVIIYHLRTYDVEEYVSCLMWMFAYLFKVLYLITYATKTTEEAQRTTDLLHGLISKLDFNERLQTELKSFCWQVTQCKVEFKAAEFFNVDRPILFQGRINYPQTLDKINQLLSLTIASARSSDRQLSNIQVMDANY